MFSKILLMRVRKGSKLILMNLEINSEVKLISLIFYRLNVNLIFKILLIIKVDYTYQVMKDLRPISLSL